VLNDGAIVGADAVLVAAGPWVGRLVPDLLQRVTPSRQIVLYAEPPAEFVSAWAAMPLLLDIDAERGFYAIPPVAGTELKFGDHRFSLDGDPDQPRSVGPEEAVGLMEDCRLRLRCGEQYRVASLVACFYTVQAQERFVVEPVGIAGWVMSPCSGHGFKFGPLLGSAVAGAIDSGDPGDIPAWAAGERQ
jgi:glycine/D-amino acid oxidase-like deaminating enzyme